jgi:3-oxoacid CoA-transferase B subunit
MTGPALLPDGVTPWTMTEVAAHAAADLPDGAHVNIGIGLPTLVPALPPPQPGTADPELIDAGKNLVTLLPGGSYFSHAEAFAMIRGGHIDVSVMGAFQVSQDGDLANWSIPGDKAPAVGGAMDLAAGARRVVVITRHTASSGEPKLVAACSLPLTARGVVGRVYTDLATLDVRGGQFRVAAAAPGVTPAVLAKLTGGEIDWP